MQHIDNPEYSSPPAIVRQYEPVVEIPLPAVEPRAAWRDASLGPVQLKFDSPAPPRHTAMDTICPTPSDDSIRHISNKPENVRYNLVYVNGIRTTPEDARRSCELARRTLGSEECSVTLVYNPEENIGASGVKIIGSLTSSRLGKKAEPQCISELRALTQHAIECPSDRLIIVAHSHGSLIVQNALDRCYDEYCSRSNRKTTWNEGSKRIDIIFFAPLVRTVAPGPNAVSLLNSADMPARGIGIFSKAVANTKHYTGWRPQQGIQTIIYTPERNRIPDLAIQPSIVHDSINLILDSTEFNFKLMSSDPKTKEPNAVLYASNLAQSIRMGKRSDQMHFELIIKGCDQFGSPFARAFLAETSEHENHRAIDKFEIRGPRLERIQRLVSER